jgi:uncharacterized protein
LKAWAGPLAGLALACASCGVLEPRPDRTRFFVLATAAELGRDGGEPPAEEARDGETVGLGPIELPEYARRNELVRRERATEVALARDERWAEPLESAVARVLAIDLSQALGAGTVIAYPWLAAEAPRTQVRIRFTRFDGSAEGRARVEARWEVVETSTQTVLASRASRFEPALEGEEGVALSRALSVALAELSNEIAMALRSASAPP